MAVDVVFPVEMVASGVPAPTRAACEDCGNSVWVEVDGRGECIRYWASGLTDKTPAAVVYVHGDRIWSGNTVAFHDNTAFAQQAYADQAASAVGMPFITIARPGLYGSSGDHRQRRQLREMQLVAGALDIIIRRHGIARFGITGQSGGGSVAAYLLGQFPDVACVAFTSACLSLQALKQAGQGQEGYDYGAPGIYDPLTHLPELAVQPGQQLFVIGDEQDESALFANQLAYYEAARQAGHAVALLRSTGRGHHGLDATGQHAVAWYLQGATVADIAARIAAGHVVN